MPNRHLHPQIAVKNSNDKNVKHTEKEGFSPGHRRSTSHHAFTQSSDMSKGVSSSSATTTPANDIKISDNVSNGFSIMLGKNFELIALHLRILILLILILLILFLLILILLILILLILVLLILVLLILVLLILVLLVFVLLILVLLILVLLILVLLILVLLILVLLILILLILIFLLCK